LTGTTWSDGPDVSIGGGNDKPATLDLEFDSAEAHTDSAGRRTRVRFIGVLEYRWIASAFTYFSWNRDDFGFCLGEVVGSELAEALLSSSIYSERGPGERLGGVVKDDRLRHFRIGFDDYGTFDVLALGVEVEAVEGKDS
jgi:hypothetical protein